MRDLNLFTFLSSMKLNPSSIIILNKDKGTYRINVHLTHSYFQKITYSTTDKTVLTVHIINFFFLYADVNLCWFENSSISSLKLFL